MRVAASLVLASALLVGGADAADAQRVVPTRSADREQRAEREPAERGRADWHGGLDHHGRDRYDRRDDRRWDRHDSRDDRRWHRYDGWDDRWERYAREHARWHRRNDPRWRDRHGRHDCRYEQRGGWEEGYLGGRDGWAEFFGGREYQRMDLGGWGYPGAWVERRGERFLLFLPDGRSLRLGPRVDARDLLALLASIR